MTPPTTPALPPLPEPPNRFAINITNTGQRLDYTAQDMRDYALAALRQAMGAAPESAKPVAWRWRSRDSSMRWGDWHYGDSQPEHVANRGVEVEALYAAPSNTDSVNSGLALTEGEPGEAPEKFILWQRRNGSRDGAGGFEWDEWAFCRREDALRVEGLHSWQIRTLIASPVAQARDSLVATASQHEKPPASGSSTAVSDTYSEYEIAGGFWDIDLPDSLCERLLIALQERRAALQASNGLGDSQPATTSTDGVKEVPRG
jgi:hypothetical protein